MNPNPHNPSGKRRGSRPVRGDITPYQIPDFINLKLKIMDGPIFFDQVVCYRNLLKQLLASRMRLAMQQNGFYKPLPGINAFIQALYERPQYRSLCGFVSCVLDYYSNPAICEYHILAPQQSTPTKQRIRKKRMADAIKSMMRLFYREVRPVLRKLEAYDTFIGEQRIIVEKYRTMSRAIALLTLLFRFLYLQPLPARLPEDTFRHIWLINSDISRFYRLEGDAYLRKAGVKKAVACCIGEEAAMTLFVEMLR